MSDEYAGGNQRSPTAKSNGVFSWLMGNRSPAHGTSKESTEQSASTITTSHVQSFASGSPSASGNVSPARTASPVGSSRSSASATRSPPRSPARRFVVPTLAMGVGGGGGRGPAVMMDIGRRTVYAQSDDDETLVEDAATIRSTADEMKELPPSVQITTRTVDGTELTENQVAEALRTVRTVSVEDNQSEPVEVQYVTKTVTTAPSTTVRYTTKTEDGDNQVPAGGVRYFTTTTTSSADGGRALPPPIPVGQGGVRYVTTTTSADGESIPMNMPTTTVRYVTKTEAGDNQTVIPGQGGVRYVTTTTTSEDGKAMPMTTPTTTVRYVTKTEEGDNQTAIPGQGGVQYVTTTTTSENGARALPPPIPVSPAGQGGVQSVRYIAKSAASPAHSTTRVSPGGVRYMTKTMVVDGGQQMLSPAAPSPAAQSGSTNVRFFGPTSTTQPNVHYVTRVVNGQSVQVPVPAGVPSHDHRVQYVTTAGSTTTPPSVSPSEHQHVRYVVKSAASPHVQTTTTRTSLTGSADGDAVSHVPLSAVVASTVASREGTAGLSPAHHVPAALLRLDSTTEGLPSRHFRGIALTDTDSSDSEDGDVKMVFDIMLQKFVPVKKKRRSPRAAAAAATVGGAVGGAAGGAAIAGAGANESGAAGAVGPAPVTTDSDSAGTGRAGAIALAAGAVGAAAIASTQLESDMEEKKAAPSAVATGDKAEVKVEGSGVVGVASAEAGSFEEKATSPSPVAAVEAPVIVAESESKPTGSGLATGAAIGLAAAAAVGAAAVVATGASNPLSVSAVVGTPKAAGGNSPGGLTKRTPSQTKREPSPRQFFAPDKAPLVPDHEVALDMDVPGTQYAALRSPSCNEGPDGSRLGHIGMSLKVRVCRWLLIMLVPLAIILFLMILFYKGVTLRKFHASDYSYGKQIDMVDNYNGYVGLITSLFVKPIELVISIAVPILFFSFVAKALLGNKLSPRLLILMFSLSSLIGFLISNGFHGIYVQMRVKGVEPVIALSDLSLQFSAAAALSALVAANASSNASMIVTEGGAGNAITNTVLRTAIAPSVDGAASGAGAAGAAGGAGAGGGAGAAAKAAGAAAKVAGAAAKAAGAAATSAGSSALLCSNTLDYTNVLGTSDLSSLTTLSTTTVATYGFPLRSWQEQMLPGALPETTVTIGLGSKTPEVGSVSALPMRVRTAANLFLHSAHIARDVFRWFGGDSLPLNANKVIAAKYGSDTGGASFVPLAELMNLTVSGNAVEETLAAPAFVSTVRTMYNQSLAGAVNISRSESTLEFSSVTLPNGYAFESVTMEIPLTKNFLSRRLTSVGSSFAEGTAPSNETDVFYDLDIANDCGPYAGACEVRRTEYDADGHVYEPPTTVRAFALCNNSVGTDELEVFIDSSVAQGKKSIAYTCNGKSDGGMLVVSVSSRIVGDAMIEGPSPLVPRLVAGMATLKNPRKVYSLTVGKLSWPMTNLARKFHAVCSAGVGKCTGLDYALTAALENATETLSAVASGSLRGVLATALDEERNKEQDYLIVGSDFLPLKLVPTFAYNDTETLDKPTTPANATKTKPVSGYPLITITKPLEGDSLFQNDGDVAAAANFKNVTWQTTKARTGASCSATVEARLNSVLNNHYYIERGVQPAYTAGMFFLFQDAVMRAQIALAGGSAVASSFSTTGGLSTLRFASTVEFMELRAKIPLLNFVLTMIGCGIIFVIAVVVAVLSARKKYSATEGHDTYAYAPPESFARVKLDRQLFPWIVMKRRVIDLTPAPMSTVTATTGSSNKGPNSQQHGGGVIGAGDEGERIDAFTVGNVRLEHDNRDVSVDVPFTRGK